MSNGIMNNRPATAKEVYEDIKKVFDKRNWKYDEEPERLRITSGAVGEDLSMPFVINVYEEKEVVYLLSYLPVENIPEDKYIDIALAVCAVNSVFLTGNYDFDIKNGELTFRMTVTYAGGRLNPEVYDQMIDFACESIDEYNDKFLALAEGTISLDEFLDGIDR